MSDSTANSAQRLLRDWHSVPQVLSEEAMEGREALFDPSALRQRTAVIPGEECR